MIDRETILSWTGSAIGLTAGIAANYYGLVPGCFGDPFCYNQLTAYGRILGLLFGWLNVWLVIAIAFMLLGSLVIWFAFAAKRLIQEKGDEAP